MFMFVLTAGSGCDSNTNLNVEAVVAIEIFFFKYYPLWAMCVRILQSPFRASALPSTQIRETKWN